MIDPHKPDINLQEVSPDVRRHAPAAQRNREAIWNVLSAELPQSGDVLEIASGTGQHVAFFAPLRPTLDSVVTR